MKKFLSTGLIFISLMGCAFATDAVQKGFISVNTEAMEELSPTTVKISFAIETSSKEPESAASLNKQTSAKVMDAIKSLVNVQKGETIKTTSYNLYPEYIYKDGARKLSTYKALNSVQVTLKDTEKTGKLISTALANGANSVNNLQFGLDDTNENCDRLMQKAAREAKLRADKIAEAIGSSVLGIKNINVGCSANQNNFSNFRMLKANASMMDATAEGDSGAMPVEAGKTQLRAYVNADFYIK